MTWKMQKRVMWSFIGLCILIIGVASHPAFAATPLDELQSLNDLIELAIINDKQLQLSELQLREVEAGLAGIDSALDPRLILNGEYKLENLANNQQVMMQQYLQFPPLDLDPTDTARTKTLSATFYKQLGLNDELQLAKDQADVGYELALIQKQQALGQLILNVQGGYKNVVVAHYGKELAQKALDNAEYNLAVLKERHASGTASELALLEAHNEVLGAKSGLLTAANGLELATISLLQTLGLERSYVEEAEPWVGELAATVELNPKKWEPDFSSIIDYGLQNRNEVQSLLKQRKLAEMELQAHTNQTDWSANIGGHYVIDEVVFQAGLDSNRALTSTLAYNDTKLPDEVDNSSDEDGTNPWQVSVGLTYTFGDGGTRRAEEQRLQSALDQIDLQLASLVDGLYLDIYSKYQQLEQAWSEYELAIQGKRQAEQTLANLQGMYALGSVAERDLRDAELYVAQAEMQVVSSTLAYQGHGLQLINALGVEPTRMLPESAVKLLASAMGI